MPTGIYLVANKTVKRGSIVSVCLPDTLAKFGLERHYLLPGSCQNGAEPLIKIVAALHNDEVNVAAEHVTINGKQLTKSQTFLMDLQGKPLIAILPRTYILKPHQVWLMGTHHERSWDSRYFGAIDEKYIQAVLVPLLVRQS